MKKRKTKDIDTIAIGGKMKIIDAFNTEDGALIECGCNQRFFIFGVNNPKRCSCGKEYVVKVNIKEVR